MLKSICKIILDYIINSIMHHVSATLYRNYIRKMKSVKKKLYATNVVSIIQVSINETMFASCRDSRATLHGRVSGEIDAHSRPLSSPAFECKLVFLFIVSTYPYPLKIESKLAQLRR